MLENYLVISKITPQALDQYWSTLVIAPSHWHRHQVADRGILAKWKTKQKSTFSEKRRERLRTETTVAVNFLTKPGNDSIEILWLVRKQCKP